MESILPAAESTCPEYIKFFFWFDLESSVSSFFHQAGYITVFKDQFLRDAISLFLVSKNWLNHYQWVC